MKMQSSGKEILIESAGPVSSGTDPDVVVLADGRIVVVWTEMLGQPTDEFDDTDGGIFARLLNADGSPAGEVFQVNDAQTFTQDRPHVVALDSGGFIIGWTTNAKYGNFPAETDTFLKVYSEVNGELLESAAHDLVQDNPTPGMPASDTDDQKLGEMVALDSDQVALLLENGDTYVYRISSNGSVKLSEGDITEMAVLANGNLIRAGATEDTRANKGGDVVKLVLTDSDFLGPNGFSGIYDPLVFYLSGSNKDSAKIGDVELAALTGGGFAVAFAEKVGRGQSVIRISVLSDEGVVEFESTPLPRDLPFNNAEFDMISLSNGGFALAMVTADSIGFETGVDILLFDADGGLETRLQATKSDADAQANPVLTEMQDGRVALVLTDASDPVTAGEINEMRLAFFDVSGESGRFIGTEGNDVLGGVAGNDTIRGLGGNDKITGRGGNDRLIGGDGVDTLDGGAGQDSLRGNQGNDTLHGGTGDDGIGGGGGEDTLFGDDGRDVLGGGAGRDVLRGGAGEDVLKGGSENDRLFGNNGNDVLRGQNGSDQLTGGAGHDVFVFTKGQSGSDTITDFNSTEDSIAIHLNGLKESAVTVSTSGGNTEIEFGNNLITLEGVTLIETDITFEFI